MQETLLAIPLYKPRKKGDIVEDDMVKRRKPETTFSASQRQAAPPTPPKKDGLMAACFGKKKAVPPPGTLRSMHSTRKGASMGAGGRSMAGGEERKVCVCVWGGGGRWLTLTWEWRGRVGPWGNQGCAAGPAFHPPL